MSNLTNNNELDDLNNKNKTFVKDQFYVDGIISCKFISSVFSDEYKKKTGTEKLKFVLTDDTINDTIINQLKNKELYFLKKTMEVAGNIRFPIQVKSFLKNSDVTVIFEVKNNPDSGYGSLIKKGFIQKTENNTTTGLKNTKQETSMCVSDKINDISLKVKFDVNEKTIKYNKGNKSKISLLDLMEINKSENLKMNVRIQCGAVFADNVLHISGTLLKINLEESKMAEIYEEIKEKSEKKINLLPRDKLFISHYPTKSSTITNNIVNIMSNKNKDKDQNIANVNTI